jgi:hypothetical protein
VNGGEGSIYCWWQRHHIKSANLPQAVGFYIVHFCTWCEWHMPFEKAVVDDFGNLVKVPS